MARKVSKNELNFIEDRLVDLEKQLDDIKIYLDTHSWMDKESDTAKSKEFKFQSELFDKQFVWLEKYTDLCGVVDFYKEQNTTKEVKLREGYEENPLQRMLMDDTLGDE